MSAPEAERLRSLTLDPHELVLVELLEERAREIALRHAAEARAHGERVVVALEALREARGEAGDWCRAQVVRRDGATLVVRLPAPAAEPAEVAS